MAVSKKKLAQHYKFRQTSKGRYSHIKNKAKQRGLEIVSYELLKPFLEQPCYYCGEVKVGLDRIDNKQGYLATNVLPCCYRCNVTRGEHWSVEETKLMVSVALKYRKKQGRI